MAKQLHLAIKQINYNRYIIEKQTYDYLQLINWFKKMITDYQDRVSALPYLLNLRCKKLFVANCKKLLDIYTYAGWS